MHIIYSILLSDVIWAFYKDEEEVVEEEEKKDKEEGQDKGKKNIEEVEEGGKKEGRDISVIKYIITASPPPPSELTPPFLFQDLLTQCIMINCGWEREEGRKREERRNER